MDVRLLWTQDAVRHLGLQVYKLAGDLNRSDLGTKKHTGPVHASLVRRCGFVWRGEVEQQPRVDVNHVELAPLRGKTIQGQIAEILVLLSGHAGGSGPLL